MQLKKYSRKIHLKRSSRKEIAGKCNRADAAEKM
jgi:hypothetical protein